jgi:sensor c-di-GMP phosphodiesterase-like protein
LKVVAIVLGVAAAGATAIFFNAWIRSQGEDEAAVTAGWALRHAEAQIGQAVATVRDLSAGGVNACTPPQIETMRRAVLHTAPVKALMLIGPNGEIACADNGVQASQHIIDEVMTPDRDIKLELVRIGDDGERLLRIRKVADTDKPALAAVIPAGLLLPQVSVRGGRLNGSIRLIMPGGEVIGETGEDEAGRELHHVSLRSRPYGLTVAAAMPAGSLMADQNGLRRIGVLVTSMMAIAILLSVLWRLRRQSGGADELAKAILAEEFVPSYQPVLDIQTGKLLGAEVLVRWKRPDGSFIEPAAFAALIESSGMLLELTRLLMRRVRDEVGPAVGRRPRVALTFNVAARHFDDALIINDVGTIFDSSPVKLSQIVLELTERDRIDNLAGMRRTVAALQRMGCKIAIDDAGTGHSGLSYILKLGVDIIKIDKVFVQSVGSDGYSKTIIETLIDLARNMRMEIVAEGVETFDQVMYLRERGVAAAQGYVFAPPLLASSFLRLLDAMEPAGDAAPSAAGADDVQTKVAPSRATKRSSASGAAAAPGRSTSAR